MEKLDFLGAQKNSVFHRNNRWLLKLIYLRPKEFKVQEIINRVLLVLCS
jgi:hypothetical protein